MERPGFRLRSRLLIYLLVLVMALTMVFSAAGPAMALDSGAHKATAHENDSGATYPHQAYDGDINTCAWFRYQAPYYVTYKSFDIQRFLLGTGPITGIRVRLRAKGHPDYPGQMGAALSWNGGNDFTAYKTVSLGANPVDFTVGGPNDLWGRESWTRTDFADTSFQVRIKVSGGGGLPELYDFDVTVYYERSIVISPSTLPGGTVGVSYSQTLTGTGGAPPYTWTTQGSLPPGLSFTRGDTTLVISGTPTEATTAPWSFTVRADDTSAECSDTKEYSIGIAKGTPSFSSLTSPVITYGTATTNLGGTISAGTRHPSGNVNITLNGVTKPASIYHATGAFSASFDTATLGVSGSPHTISYNYPGDSNYVGISGTGTLTVNKATATVTLGNLNHTYNGTPKSATATTEPQGLVVGLTYNGSATPPTAAGSYTVVGTVSNPNYQGSQTGTLVISKTNQTISFDPIVNKAYGDPPFQVYATATSGLPVVFSIASGPATVSGNTVTLTGAGDVVVRASQPGDNNHNAAANVDRSFKVGYTLTVNIVGSGTVTRSPNQQTYNHGDQVQLAATPGADFRFGGWSGDLAGTANPATITINANKTVTATFLKEYTVTVNIDGPGSVTKNPNQEFYADGSSVQLTASPTAANWRFASWSGDLTGTANPATLTVNGSKTVTARFGFIFPDANLDAAVRAALYKPTGDLLRSDLENLIELSAESKGIANLSGLEYCTNLSTLVLRDNQIADISALRNLTKLRNVVLDNNLITDMSPLANRTSLVHLDLKNNQVTDTSHVANCTSLVKLFLQNNKISIVPPLGSLINLDQLDLSGNTISGLPNLSGLTKLNRLDINSNHLSDVSALSTLGNLQILYLNDNRISDLSPLGNLSQLHHLELNGNQISRIPELKNLPELWSLYLANNQISDISGLATVGQVYSLDLRNNQLTNISALSNHSGTLKKIWLDNNQISDLSPLANMSGGLEILSLNDNKISSVSPLSTIPALARLRLYLNNNQISDVSPLGNVWFLEYLEMQNNRISDISSLLNSNLPVFQRLNLSQNLISDISALVANSHIGSGDTVDISSNNLDLGTGSPDMANINTLIGRGVTLTYEPQKNYTLSVDIVGNGTVTRNPSLLAYYYGSSVQLTATAGDNWNFSSWSGDVTGSANPATITMDRNKTVSATFATNAPPLAKPAKPVLINSIATWTSVANENAGYSVILYKNGVATGTTGEVAHGSPLRYDFSAAMTNAGSYTVTVIAKGTGAFSNSPESDLSDQQIVVGTGGTAGQAQLASGTSNLLLGNNGTIDLRSGVQIASGNQIIVGGQSQGSYTGGNLSNMNLTAPRNIGGQSVQVQKAVRLESGVDGQPVTIANSGNSNAGILIPDGTGILAPASWDGTMIPPRVALATGTAPSGFSIGNLVIGAGSPGAVLLFDRPVTLEIKGVNGPVGYKPAGSDTWVHITRTAGGTYDNPVAPEFPGEAIITNGTNTRIITWHFTSFASLVPMPRISVSPTTLIEAEANDGSLASGTLVITLENGTFVTEIAKADVSAANLPAGLDYTVTRTDATHLTIGITGSSTEHANANDVSNLTFTIARSKITGAQNDLTIANISIDFSDPTPVVPPAPANLTAGAPGGSQVSLNWTDNATDETGFLLQRAADSGFTQKLTAHTLGAHSGTGAVSWVDTSVSAGVTYYYRIRAYNAVGNSAWSNTASVSLAGTSVFDFAVVALDGNLTMEGNASTASDPSDPPEADIYANGSIILTGNAQVRGDAKATGFISQSANSRVVGAKTPSLKPPLAFAMPDTPAYLAQAKSGNPDTNALRAQAQNNLAKKKTGNYSAPSGAVLGTNGTYSWIAGDLTIGGNDRVTLNGVLLVNGTVTVKGNARIGGTGVIISESTNPRSAIRVEGNAQLKADSGDIMIIAASGGIKASGNAIVVASVFAPAGDMDFDGNSSIITMGPMHSAGSLTISGNTQVALGGTVWFDGGVSMAGSSGLQGTGALVAMGDINLTGNAKSQPVAAPPLVISTGGRIEISGNGWLGAVAYAPRNEVRLIGNSKVYGSLVGKTVALAGNAQVKYPVSLRNPQK